MRSRPIDVLRALAVLLVLLHHFGPWAPINSVGWMGVDLFFVLSGYLVSGLLFDELARTGAVRPGRFLLRRGFKIYPSFWLMILLSVTLMSPVRPLAVSCELLFLQNYGPGLWVHTWSLAVEEHFYLLVAAGFAWRGVFRSLATARARLVGFGSGLVLIFVLRVLTVLLVPSRYKLVTFGTHVRIDALLSGVALSWMLRDEQMGPRIRGFVRERRPLVLIAALLALAPACVLGKDHLFTATAGLTLAYLGFAAVLLLSLSVEMKGPLSRALARVGKSSYSIYLWHIPLQSLLFDRLATNPKVPRVLLESSAMLIGASIVTGILVSHLIENPFLRLRDRWVKA